MVKTTIIDREDRWQYRMALAIDNLIDHKCVYKHWAPKEPEGRLAAAQAALRFK